MSTLSTLGHTLDAACPSCDCQKSPQKKAVVQAAARTPRHVQDSRERSPMAVQARPNHHIEQLILRHMTEFWPARISEKTVHNIANRIRNEDKHSRFPIYLRQDISNARRAAKREAKRRTSRGTMKEANNHLNEIYARCISSQRRCSDHMHLRELRRVLYPRLVEP